MFTLKYDPKYFCDRENEIQYLRDNITNGLNTVVHSPRRLGKSALIQHLFYNLEKEKVYDTLYVDIFATQNLQDLVKQFGEVLLKKYHSKNLLNGIKKLFSGLQASVSFSTDGSPQLNLGIEATQVNMSLSQLFGYLESRSKKVVLAFDEFQEIAGYPEKAEAMLRAHIQQLKNVQFIFSGSPNHILQNMFLSAKQPFFQSSESIVIEKINRDNYGKFIESCFYNGKKDISSDAIAHFLKFTEVHTYYTQIICNQAFYKSSKHLNYEDALEITSNYIEVRKLDYFSIYNLLPDNQKSIVKAIAKEGVVLKPSAVGFLIKHKLPSSSSTLQALHSLVDKEIIYRSNDGYKVYDVFFRRFLEKYF